MLKKLLPVLLVLAAFLFPAVASAGDLGLKVSPDQINIGLNFKGASLEIAGEAPTGADIYMKVESPPGIVALNRKGKVGPFWMSTDKVQAENVPKVYEIITSGSLAKLPQKLQEQMAMGPEYSYLKEQASVTHKSESSKTTLSSDEATSYLNGLISIYENRGYYKISENALQNENGSFRTTVQLPSGIPPGQTKITVYAVSGDKVVASQELPLQVNSVGMVNWTRSEATTNGPFYGLIAVIVALAVGLGIGTLFNSLGSRKGAEANSGAH